MTSCETLVDNNSANVPVADNPHPHVQLIMAFYQAFQHTDWRAMGQCYHAQIHFSDPVFPSLKGQEAMAMWHMLCEKAQDFDLQFDQVGADDTMGYARWKARYTLTDKKGNKRRVKNIIYAQFQFQDGRIIRHSDHFSFWRWSTMSLGLIGWLLGWSGYLRRQVRKELARRLTRFCKQRPELYAS